jgi:hypothetical protein
MAIAMNGGPSNEYAWDEVDATCDDPKTHSGYPRLYTIWCSGTLSLSRSLSTERAPQFAGPAFGSERGLGPCRRRCTQVSWPYCSLQDIAAIFRTIRFTCIGEKALYMASAGGLLCEIKLLINMNATPRRNVFLTKSQTAFPPTLSPPRSAPVRRHRRTRSAGVRLSHPAPCPHAGGCRVS